MFSVKIITVDAVSAVIPRLSGEAIVSHLEIVVDSWRELSHIHLMRVATSTKVKMLQITQFINTAITRHVCFGPLPKS